MNSTEKNHQRVWDKIAEEWSEFKKNPARGIEEFLKNKEGKILDLGSGSGRNLIELKNVEWYLVDFSGKMLKLAEKKAKEKKIKIKTFAVDLTELPFKDEFFYSAIAIASIHCIEGEKNRKKAVEELFRVLKPKSEAFIAVWNKDSKRFKNSPREKYVGWTNKGLRYYYLFEENEIHELFKKAGFKIKKKIESEVNIAFVVGK